MQNSFLINAGAGRLAAEQKEKSESNAFGLLGVEHSGFEPLTPTLPVWCATSCANAPSTRDSIAQDEGFVKG